MDFEILKLLSPDGEPGTGEPEGKKEEPPGAENYLKKLEELKKTTVPKKDYDSLVEDNKKLVDALANGHTIEDDKQKEPTKEERDKKIQSLRNELYRQDCDLGNREYMKKTLELRKELIASGERDPMLPPGSITTNDDIEGVEKFVKVAQECIDNSQSDETFTALMQENTAKDLPRPRHK